MAGDSLGWPDSGFKLDDAFFISDPLFFSRPLLGYFSATSDLFDGASWRAYIVGNSGSLLKATMWLEAS